MMFHIDETKTFTFHFPFIGMSEMTCNVQAQTKEEAIELIRGWFHRTITDFSINYPKVEPVKFDLRALDNDFTLNQREQIGILIKDVSKYLLPEQTFQETVKKYTTLEAIPINFVEIIARLTEMSKTFNDNVKKVDETESGGSIIENQDVKPKKNGK